MVMGPVTRDAGTLDAAELDRDQVYRDRVKMWHHFTQYTRYAVIGTAIVLALLALIAL